MSSPALSPQFRVLPPLPRPLPTGLELLTPHERLVAAHIAEGYSNKEISAILGRAEGTVKNQVASCLRKFNAPSRCRLIAQLWADRFERERGGAP